MFFFFSDELITLFKCLIALFNADHQHAELAAQEAETKRISLQITPNGSEWIGLERNVPSGYCQYNLEALSTCADLSTTLVSHSGQLSDDGDDSARSSIWEFSTEDGRSLRNSIYWLLPYATNTTVWPYEPRRPQRSFVHLLAHTHTHTHTHTWKACCQCSN